MKTRLLPLFLAAALPAGADEVASLLRPVALQGGSSQAAVGGETAELARQIAALSEELERNGFPKESLGGLAELVQKLNTLGGADMGGLAARLRAAAQSSGGDITSEVAGVYSAQQAVQSRLVELAHQLVVQKLREEAIRRLEKLILRQLAAQRETRALGSARNHDATRQQLLVSDQTGIGSELAAFLDTGDTLLAKIRGGAQLTPDPSAPAAAAGPSFSEKVNAPRLNTLSTEAVAALEKRLYPDAFQRQQTLLDELRRVLQAILSSQSEQQRLSAALQQLAALQQQAASPAQDAQALADQAALLAAQVAPLNAEAAQMLASSSSSAATPPSAEAMQDAQAALQQQLASAQAASQPPKPGSGPSQQAGSGQGGTPLPPSSQPSMQSGDSGFGETGGLIAGSGGGATQGDFALGALDPKDAAAMEVLQNERAPAENAAWVSQYWRNLAGDN